MVGEKERAKKEKTSNKWNVEGMNVPDPWYAYMINIQPIPTKMEPLRINTPNGELQRLRANSKNLQNLLFAEYTVPGGKGEAERVG